jgi:hypothetical protein
MNILSFDCANRSLAVCFLYVNDKNINNMSNYIHFINVFDITEGKEQNSISRTKLLKQTLLDIDKKITELKLNINHVLVEYQMSLNDKSRCVSQQIIFHYSNLEPLEVHLIGPSLKNKIYLENLQHCFFMEKYTTKYSANKNHTKANFLRWMALKKISIPKEIKKKNYDDIADAFMQIFGWLNS